MFKFEQLFQDPNELLIELASLEKIGYHFRSVELQNITMSGSIFDWKISVLTLLLAVIWIFMLTRIKVIAIIF